MTASETITLFHAPNSRSNGTLILLEELGVPYDLHVLNLQAGEQRHADYLAVNPMGKVPAIRHRGVLVGTTKGALEAAVEAWTAGRVPARDPVAAPAWTLAAEAGARGPVMSVCGACASSTLAPRGSSAVGSSRGSVCIRCTPGGARIVACFP